MADIAGLPTTCVRPRSRSRASPPRPAMRAWTTSTWAWAPKAMIVVDRSPGGGLRRLGVWRSEGHPLDPVVQVPAARDDPGAASHGRDPAALPRTRSDRRAHCPSGPHAGGALPHRVPARSASCSWSSRPDHRSFGTALSASLACFGNVGPGLRRGRSDGQLRVVLARRQAAADLQHVAGPGSRS